MEKETEVIDYTNLLKLHFQQCIRLWFKGKKKTHKLFFLFFIFTDILKHKKQTTQYKTCQIQKKCATFH